MGFFAYDDLESEEIDLQINNQIYEFIEAVVAVYKGQKPKVGVAEGFQADQVSLDSLRTIHVREENRPLTVVSGEGQKFDLPATYLHHIKTKLTVTYQCIENGQNVTKTVTPKPALRIGNTQDIDTMKRSSFYKSMKESPLGEIVGDSVYIYENGFTVTGASLDYIKRPVKVLYNKDINGAFTPTGSFNCDLPDSVHYTIVKMTAIKIAKIIETPQQKIVNLEN